MSNKFKPFRMDFIQTVVSMDEKSGKVAFRIEPDPRRYEWKEVKGERCLYDKLDDVYIPEQVLLNSFKKIGGMPIYFQPQMIGDAEKYIKSRKPLIKNMLKEREHPPTFQDKSEDFLQSLEQDKLAFVIISLDIVGSTKLATATDPKSYARLISTVLYELSEVIPKFHGHVLKYTGDGLIAYFPEPSFITKNDLAVDCALMLRGLVYKALNPIFKERGFPTIDIRIGIEAGEAYVETIGSPETKQHKDIIGSVVSLAAKIQGLASPGEVFLGDITERNLHTMWRQVCEPVALGKGWNYRDSDGNVYKVHRVKVKQ